jgi:ParB family chromosome partitioning protein
MAKQTDYLASLLNPAAESTPEATPARRAATTLLARESALARVTSGEVKQVTQLLLDPARVRVWPGNARLQAALSEPSCRDLIDSILAEGGQRVPAIVRRVEDVEGIDYEVIAGTRRHFAVSWLRAHAYPDVMFLAQVHNLDDEAAFRLADLENRARKDVSDLERARNYAAALRTHYDSHLTRMAERLRLSKGWLSKMIKVAALPDPIIAAFASIADVQLKPAYALAAALDDDRRRPAMLHEAAVLAGEQEAARTAGFAGPAATEVQRRLLSAHVTSTASASPEVWLGPLGRPMLSLQSTNRQGATVRVHAGSGASPEDLARAFQELLAGLKTQGKGVIP